MRFRLGFVSGFAAGYYFGTKAGRERYHQLERLLSKARENEAVHTATERARAAAEQATERAKDLVGKVTHNDEPDPCQPAVDTGVISNGTKNPSPAPEDPGATSRNPSPA